MEISTKVVRDFVKQVQPATTKKSSSAEYYATAKVSGGKLYVNIDGSEIDTPVSTATTVQNGDRVKVQIVGHTAMVTTNLSSSAVGIKDLEKILSNSFGDSEDNEILTNVGIVNSVFAEGLIVGSVIQDSTITGSKIQDSTITGSKIQNSSLTGSVFVDGAITGSKIADSTITNSNIQDGTIKGSKLSDVSITSAKIDYASFEKLEGEELKATQAAIDKLLSVSIRVGDIVAEDGTIKTLHSEDLHAATGFIGELTSNNITANTIVSNAATIHNLKSTYATIDFANVDTANIQEAWINELMVQGKIIAQEGTIYYLDSVEVNADKITAGTLLADRILLTGENGLFYEINATSSEITAEQLDTVDYQNGVHGSKIIAKSVTAEQITVEDLHAITAKVGGWTLTEDSLYSSTRSEFAKENAVGVYLGSNGSLDIGSDDQFVRFDPVTGLLQIQSNNIRLTATESLQDRLGTLESRILQNADNITFAFGQSGDLNDDWQLFKTYFKFGALEDLGGNGTETIDGIEIGKNSSENPFKTRITNAGIAFIDNGALLSYIANDTMYTSNSAIMNTLRFNDFIWMRRDNGNMSLKHLNLNDPNASTAIPSDIYDMFGVPNPNIF